MTKAKSSVGLCYFNLVSVQGRMESHHVCLLQVCVCVCVCACVRACVCGVCVCERVKDEVMTSTHHTTPHTPHTHTPQSQDQLKSSTVSHDVVMAPRASAVLSGCVLMTPPHNTHHTPPLTLQSRHTTVTQHTASPVTQQYYRGGEEGIVLMRLLLPSSGDEGHCRNSGKRLTELVMGRIRS